MKAFFLPTDSIRDFLCSCFLCSTLSLLLNSLSGRENEANQGPKNLTQGALGNLSKGLSEDTVDPAQRTHS